MKTPLAWFNLVHNKMRTTLAVAGVSFAVVLIFMQLGFLGSAERSATLVYDALDFDVLIRSSRYLYLTESRTFPRERLYQAASVQGVQRASPLYLAMNQWRHPKTGQRRLILTLGVRPKDPVFLVEEIRRKSIHLTAPGFLLIDRKSRSEFGPRDKKTFGDADLGMETELLDKRVRIVGHFAMGVGFAADGAVLLNDQGFARIAPDRTLNDVSLGLVKLNPGSRADVVAAGLRDIFPFDVEVFTRAEVNDFERRRWVRQTSVGVIFQLGVAVAMLVGTAIVYQVLSSDVATHLAEYATLKAMGYSGGFLAGVVLQQAITLALVGFLCGLLLSQVLYCVTSYVANIPIEMNLQRAVFVLILSVVMCTISGLGALRKLHSADPVDLF